MSKFQFKYEITIIDFKQYLLKNDYEFNHNYLKIPMCLRHPLNNLRPEHYKFFVYLIGQAIRKKTGIFTISNSENLPVQAQWYPSRRAVLPQWLKVLEEKQLLNFKDLIRLEENKENSPFPSLLVNKSEAPISEIQKPGPDLKIFSNGKKTREDLLKESEKLSLSEDEQRLLKTALRRIPG